MQRFLFFNGTSFHVLKAFFANLTPDAISLDELTLFFQNSPVAG